ncbi:MAG: 50S ribosomal protein L17 [Candidatus Omnitrophica bacterium]|nr:50S ribosomal protein L17 [Candidatus Omnitrophota bacterium]
MLAHIVEGLIEHQRVRTTIDRAKEARRLAEKLITIAKRNTLHARRQIISELYSEPLAKKMFEKVAPAFSQVKGGYTRIIRESCRPGDGAQMVYLEFSKPIEVVEPKPKAKKEKGKAVPQKKKWEDVKVVKKETLEEEKSKKEKKPKGEETKPSEVQKTDEEKKKGGFLTTLRKFLKGDK